MRWDHFGPTASFSLSLVWPFKRYRSHHAVRDLLGQLAGVKPPVLILDNVTGPIRRGWSRWARGEGADCCSRRTEPEAAGAP